LYAYVGVVASCRQTGFAAEDNVTAILWRADRDARLKRDEVNQVASHDQASETGDVAPRPSCDGRTP
jgi:hypothetical protein